MRTAQRRSTLIAAAVALLVAGCGTGPAKVGSAAIVGDTVLPLQTVQQRLEVVLDKEPEARKLHDQRKLDQVARQLVTLGVQHELIGLAAQREGITVSEEDVAESVEQAGGADMASQNTVYDATTFRERAKDQLLLVELARKYVDRMEVTFDYFFTKDNTEAVEKAKQVAADPAKMAEFIAAAPRSEQGQSLGRENQVVRSAESPQSAQSPLFGVEPGTVVAFPPDPGSAQWIVAHVKERRTDVRPSSDESSTEQLTPQLLEQIGLRLVQQLAGDPSIRVNPRYGVWDTTAISLAPSEGELSGYQATARQIAP
ncbi:SurA N-terminal domain-containing protein [Saccharothrix longispora]|uniref:SurA N-terminal domain-containing protein n=1 Tax=Saccharothrix longispora TaxID=33920 RepID=UPI0028FDAC03|nr:SurA N-terminal domain-containing protein [Saccharothrix longispora]MBY8848201.1 SurA N-terminal domain-containing protein [Saccharothrix sp. MB29]MDU0289643.1 SurA N-terminal domain-containing protein [Saccharothrix longispora]